MAIKDFIEFIEGWLGKLNPEEGLLYGNPDNRVTGITVCWMVTEKVIDFSAEKSHNFIITHEDLLFPPGYASSDSANLTEKPGMVSKKRIDLLDRNGISVLRLHSLTDRHFILDDVGKVLSLGEPVVKNGLQRVYEIQPVSLEKFAWGVKKSIGTPHIRVTGNKNQKVRRIGSLWGGVGLSINAGFINNILNYKVDTVISGESDEYTMRALIDINVGLVEIGHETSEEPGLRNFANAVREKMKTVPVQYISNNPPYKVL